MGYIDSEWENMAHWRFVWPDIHAPLWHLYVYEDWNGGKMHAKTKTI
ncbi:hypothetical protein [Butyrivibrio sp. WCD2001]|nr:hypothetical protein [Butyrivibrio sp. WCD2001]